jgi:transposase
MGVYFLTRLPIAAYILLHVLCSPGFVTRRNTKAERLKALKSLNRHPERVRAPWFQTGTFFDAQDLVQVKYEMLRHVKHEGASKAEAAEFFGFSRPAFYQAEAALEREGLAGLLPRRRGPKGAHKLTAQIMTFIERRQAQDPQVHARALAREIQAQLNLSVHPRSIERALARKKKRQTPPP